MDLPERYEKDIVALMDVNGETHAVTVPKPGTITEPNEYGLVELLPDGTDKFQPMGVRVRAEDVVRVDGVVFREDVEIAG